VQNFIDVGAMQFNLVYDPAVLQFDKVQNYAPLMGFGSGNTNLFAPGELRVVWFNGNIENETLPDGTVLFEICFDVIGTGGQFSDITFGGTPEISDTDGNLYSVNITPARITAQCALEGFALIADSLCAQPNHIECIDISVNDFEDIIALQFSMNWDSTKFKFDHVEAFGLPGLDAGGFGTPYDTPGGAPGVKNGQLTVSWIDLSLQGVTLPDNGVIFRLCLKAIGPVNSSTSIIFSGNPLDIEIASLDSVITSYTLVQGFGQVKEVCGGCVFSYVLNELNPTCAGAANGVLNLTLMTPGCACTPTYLWSTGATSQDITGLTAGTYSVTITCEQIVIATATLEDPAAPNIQANITTTTPPQCIGAIDITVSGGTPPFTFLWSNNAVSEDVSNLCAGVYTVTITDNNGCTSVGGPYVIGGFASVGITHVSCNGVCDGALDLTPTFGTGPYTYVWNTVPVKTTEDLTGLCAGNYCVTITDSGGSTRDTCFTITQPPVLTATSTISHDVLQNCTGAIDLNVTGGTQPYSYIWSNGGTNQDLIGLCVGQFCVTVTDAHGCTFNACYDVSNNNFNVSLSAQQFGGGFETSCAGSCNGSITSTVVGGTAPVTYHWSNNASTANLSGLCAGTYSVTVTDAGGQTATASIVIASPPALNLNVSVTDASGPGISDGAASVVVTGGVPGYTYQWTGPVNWNTAAQNNIPGGSYFLVVTDANGCEESESVLVPGGDDGSCYKGLSVFTPNSDGYNDFFKITCLSFPNHLFIFNRQGALVYETDNYQNNWIGVDQDDEAVPDGGYLWVLEALDNNGVKTLYKGAVVLLRTAD
jgi:gliding motility-associated-like protein